MYRLNFYTIQEILVIPHILFLLIKIISHQIKDTIGKEEEMEAWREMSDFFGEQFEINILEIQTKYIDDKNVIDTEASASAEKFKKKRRPTLNYFEMGLKEGDILKFGRNEEFCTVLSGREVTYKGESWFLSNLTNKLLDRTGPMNGSPYWYFKGKNLQDIYNETYSIELLIH